MGAASTRGAPSRSRSRHRSCSRRGRAVNALAVILLLATFVAASGRGAEVFDDSVGAAASTTGKEGDDLKVRKVQGSEGGDEIMKKKKDEIETGFVAGSGASEDKSEDDEDSEDNDESEDDEDNDAVAVGVIDDDDGAGAGADRNEEAEAAAAEDGEKGASKAASLVDSAVSFVRGLFGAEEEKRALSQRKYVQTKERKGRKKKAQGGTTMTKKEMRLWRLRRRRRRRRRKRGQTLADVGVGVGAKKQNANGGMKKKTVANGALLPNRVQDRMNDNGGGDAASSSEDKEFADRASSRTRNSMKNEEEADSKGGPSSDGPQMTAGAPVSDDTQIKWRCAYPGEKVPTTDIPESISMAQQISFTAPAPQPKPKGNSWLNGWKANGGFGKRRENNDGNNHNRRAAEQSFKGGGDGPQQVAPSQFDDKIYVLPRGHRLCKDMQFSCPQICDESCLEFFTCTYPAPPSKIVAQPAEEQEKRPPGQKRLPPLSIASSSSGKGKGKGGYASTYRTQAGRGGNDGSSSDDYSNYKTHRDGRPRNLEEGADNDETEEDSFDADLDLVAEHKGRDLRDSFDDLPRSLQGNSKGTARPPPTPAPVGPQLVNVDVKPKCTSTNNQLLPNDYYMCSIPEPAPEPECPKDLPESGKDYDKLVENLPNRCKEPEEPAFLPPAPSPKPPIAIDDTYTTTEDTPITVNIIGELMNFHVIFADTLTSACGILPVCQVLTGTFPLPLPSLCRQRF